MPSAILRRVPSEPQGARTTYRIEASEDRVRIVFEGRLDFEAGKGSAEQLVRLLRARPRHVVWDVRRMTGYDALAREVWQRELWPCRKNLLGVTVVGGSSMVRLGARAVCFFLDVACSFQDHE